MALTHPRDRQPVTPEPPVREFRKKEDDTPRKPAVKYSGKKPKVELHYQMLEHDKPSGGGKGPRAPYVVSVIINGELALQLTAFNFKKSGQMQQLIDYFEGVEE